MYSFSLSVLPDPTDQNFSLYSTFILFAYCLPVFYNAFVTNIYLRHKILKEEIHRRIPTCTYTRVRVCVCVCDNCMPKVKLEFSTILLYSFCDRYDSVIQNLLTCKVQTVHGRR